MTPDYAALDAAIMRAIGDGFWCVCDIQKVLFINHLMAVWSRRISERLQSLRKRGLIIYQNGRWSAVEKV